MAELQTAARLTPFGILLGGVKQSGFGRQGLRYAIEEMTGMKLVAYDRR
jgi:acyl-CoA reductase-like NAD-dependent aldehyde dehydrogenase